MNKQPTTNQIIKQLETAIWNHPITDLECDHVCSGNCRREGCNCECGEFHIVPEEKPAAPTRVIQKGMTAGPGFVTMTFTPDEYCVLYDSLGNEFSLNYLIDRSYKGKSPDVGLAVLNNISSDEAELFVANGFLSIDL